MILAGRDRSGAAATRRLSTAPAVHFSREDLSSVLICTCCQAPTFTVRLRMLLFGNIQMITLECCREPTSECRTLVLAARRRRCRPGIGRRAAHGGPDAGRDRQKAGHGPYDGDRHRSGAEHGGEPFCRALQPYGLRPDRGAARG